MKLIGTTLVIGLIAFATQTATNVIDNIKNKILKQADEKLESIFLSFSDPNEKKEEKEKKYTYQDDARAEERYQHPEQYIQQELKKESKHSSNKNRNEEKSYTYFFENYDI